MVIHIKGQDYDMVSDACRRLGISRPTLLKYIDDGYFTEPPRQRQGRSKTVRYFPDDWYAQNEPKLKNPPS